MSWWNKRSTLNAQRSTPNGDPLTEQELDLALARPADQDPTWRAVLQLIDTAEANANDNAHTDIDNYGICAGYVGGGAHLRLLRQELRNRRAHGLELLGRVRKTAEL